MRTALSTGSDGVVLLGWKSRDAALAMLQQDCNFDPPLDDRTAEVLWAYYRERVNALRGRVLPSPDPLVLNADERRVADEFLGRANNHRPMFRDVIKLDPRVLAVRQLEITTARSKATAERLHAPVDWASECLCPATSSVRPTIHAAPNSMDVDLPHGEWALLFDSARGFVLGEAAPCVTVTTIGTRTVLWSGYHRAYAAAAWRSASERTILAAIVDDVKPDPGVRSCGLRAARSDNPPIVADFFDPDLSCAVRFRIKRFRMEIRARVVACVDDSREQQDAGLLRQRTPEPG